jgi:hypothetical protein
MAVTGLKMFGVAALADGDTAPLAPQTALVRWRELGAVVRPAPFARVDMSDREVNEYQAVVESVFEQRTILPAPFGVVFRSRDQVERWLKMHYIALTEGVHLVDGRCVMRLHIRSPDADTEDGEVPDGAAQAAEAFRALRRQAAAAVPLRTGDPHPVLSGAFLVERASWRDFVNSVAEQAKRSDGLRFEPTGPWPPYDFVRLDLGG